MQNGQQKERTLPMLSFYGVLVSALRLLHLKRHMDYDHAW
ncbi:unnamed protein product, partial [Vitis vinifera]